MLRTVALLSLLLSSFLLAPAARAQGPAPGIYAIPISSLPYTISSSGTYYLLGNLTGVTGQSGIRINASNVNLNLNGRTLRGAPGARVGIEVGLAGANTITIQNGTICNWPLGGIDATSTVGMHLDGVVVNDCQIRGMSLGAAAMVQRCTARANGGIGIFVSDNSSLDSCLAIDNSGHGISTGVNTRVSNCTASENDEDGILVSGESTVSDSLATANGRSGIRAGDHTSVLDCNASRNLLHGIVVVHSSRVNRCLAGRNGAGANPASVGILAEGSNNVIDNNQTVSNGIGYRALGLQNFISANTSQAEVGFSVNPGNVVGPILSAAEVVSAKNPTSNFDL